MADGSGMVVQVVFTHTFTNLCMPELRCEQLLCEHEPMKPGTTGAPGTCLGIRLTTWAIVAPMFTAKNKSA